MRNINFKQHLKACAFLSVALLSLTACSAEQKIDYELTGRVLDSVTKQPLEGAYVVAVYMGGGSVAGGHSSSWCRKTLGMYTKADGKFNFPVEGRGSLNPTWPVAIKPGYGTIKFEFTNVDLVTANTKLYYTDQNLLLTPQNPAKLDLAFQTGESYCPRAKSKQDAAAGAEFYKIALAERVKYGAPAKHIEIYQSIISELESLPNAPPNLAK
jgi:hypothetical protein